MHTLVRKHEHPNDLHSLCHTVSIILNRAEQHCTSTCSVCTVFHSRMLFYIKEASGKWLAIQQFMSWHSFSSCAHASQQCNLEVRLKGVAKQDANRTHQQPKVDGKKK